MTVECSFTPDGRWDAATIAFLWPYIGTPGTPASPNAATIGSDPFGSGGTDTTTVIHELNGHLHTIRASAVTKMPSLLLSAASTMIGQATITGIRKSAQGWSDTSSIYTAALTGSTFNDSTFAPSLIKTQNYTGIWTGKTGFESIITQSGWTVDFDAAIEYIQTDEIGTTRAVLNSVSVMAKCTPLGQNAANLLTALNFQESSSKRGSSGNANSADLTITGADGQSVVVVKAATLQGAGFNFGSKVVRDGELAWVATRGFTTGAPDALCTLAAP